MTSSFYDRIASCCSVSEHSEEDQASFQHFQQQKSEISKPRRELIDQERGRRCQQQEPNCEDRNQKPPARISTRAAAGIIVFVVLIHAAMMLIWFGYRTRAQSQSLMNETLMKLRVIEQGGHDVREYYARIRNSADTLRSPLIIVVPFIANGAHAEIREIDEKVRLRYGEVLAARRMEVRAQMSSFATLLKSAESFSYPSKKTITAAIQTIGQRLDSNNLPVNDLEEIEKSLVSLAKQAQSELLHTMNKELGLLESAYSVSVNFNYPSRQEIEAYIAERGGKTHRDPPELTEIISALHKIRSYKEAIAREVEEQKRQMIFTNIANTTKEVDALLTFFSARSGYTEDIALLTRYKNNVSAYRPELFADVSAQELQKRAEEELFSLVVTPRSNKIAAEEKERKERAELQRRMQEEAGIPVPPLDVPKLIYVDLAKQRLYAYENGMSIFREPVPVTTGKRGFETVTGQYAIYQKFSPFRMRSPFPGIHYDNHVDFFMPFYQGYGFHDASWRTVYGTPDYLDVGSHGCINTPYAYIKQLYYWADIGTTVLIQ